MYEVKAGRQSVRELYNEMLEDIKSNQLIGNKLPPIPEWYTLMLKKSKLSSDDSRNEMWEFIDLVVCYSYPSSVSYINQLIDNLVHEIDQLILYELVDTIEWGKVTVPDFNSEQNKKYHSRFSRDLAGTVLAGKILIVEKKKSFLKNQISHSELELQYPNEADSLNRIQTRALLIENKNYLAYLNCISDQVELTQANNEYIIEKIESVEIVTSCDKRPQTFEGLFRNPSMAEPCLEILRSLTRPVITEANEYTTKVPKLIFPYLLERLFHRGLIHGGSTKSYIKVLNKTIIGLNLSEEGSTFRKKAPSIAEISKELDVRLSQLSQLSLPG